MGTLSRACQWVEGHIPTHAGFVPSQTTTPLPCLLDMPFEAVPFFLSLLRTLSRYILADPRELVGRMRDFAEEGLPYDAL